MKKFKQSFTGIALLLSTTSSAFDHSHKAFTEILKDTVSYEREEKASVVDYQKIHKNPEKLNQYLSTLSAVSGSEFEKFSEKEQLAFLINAYNAFTLKTIADFYRPKKKKPDFTLKSIRDVCDYADDCPFLATGKVWKRKFFTLKGKKSSLDEIEHAMLRVDYKEPRIHFAINCASIGCPALRQEAFTAENLEEQLNVATAKFLSDETRNRYSKKENTLYLSEIFSWFKKDFVSTAGSVQVFTSKWMKNPKDSEVEHTDYDWALNKKTQ